jgi:hypothetical protein
MRNEYGKEKFWGTVVFTGGVLIMTLHKGHVMGIHLIDHYLITFIHKGVFLTMKNKVNIL